MDTHSDSKVELALRREKARQHLEAESKLQNQINHLQEQMRKLRLQGGKAQRAMKKSELGTMAALESFAKLDCQQFCDSVYAVFPREIRDNIYGFIHPGGEMFITEQRRRNPWGDSAWDKSLLSTYFDYTSEPHWSTATLPWGSDLKYVHLWNAEYIGKSMFPELIEQYFQSTRFNFDAELYLVPRFQFTDQWNIGNTPADFITSIGVSIACSGTALNFDAAFSKKKLCRGYTDLSGYDLCAHSDYEPPQNTRRTQLLANLQSLFGFKSGTKISIRIRTCGVDNGILGELAYARDTVIPIILSTLQRLSKSGLVVKVVLAEATSSYGWTVPEFVVDGATPTLEAWAEAIEKLEEVELQRREGLESIAWTAEDEDGGVDGAFDSWGGGGNGGDNGVE
ncbi:hypothetical protein BKA63DRAFT_555971 [Paraphoma chrysanthemicola]|nr:hypothetical protein BKA63DRAFT_555971 [Paraphoma chrysanthemicola]